MASLLAHRTPAGWANARPRWSPAGAQPHCRLPRSVKAFAANAKEIKKAAAKLFVDTFVRDGQVVGLGTGELCSLCIEEIALRVSEGKLKNVRGVPASTVSAGEAAFHGLPLHSDATVEVDLAFEQIDQLDATLNASILGVVGEPQQPQLYKALVMLQQRAAQVVVLVEQKNLVSRLRGTVPVLIEAKTWEETAEEVDDLVIGDAEVWRRAVPGSIDPNPRGGNAPYVSEEGHNFLDLRYDGPVKLFGELESYEQIESAIMDIPGVVATGMLLDTADAAVVWDSDGGRVINFRQQ